MKRLLVTGSGGLIGSEVVSFFAELGWDILGLDNNMREDFFGKNGSTTWNVARLSNMFSNYKHYNIDIRNREEVIDLIKKFKPQAIVHTAAQPSHDLAAQRPFDDFDVNATGTMNLLEALRLYCPESPFVHLSTNKVYGDAPNNLKLKELEKRWDYDDIKYINGINETFTIDQSKHSLFGASKLAADIMVQEYGRYFGIPTCCLRGGCLTGPNHSGVELHGFLSYLIKCNVVEKKYVVFGYNGKQVRDNIHSYDVTTFINEFLKDPQIGEVYNLGGGRDNSVSILEAFEKIESLSGKNMIFEYNDKNREGDHICYISDLSKMKKHYPNWKISKNLDDIFQEIYLSWVDKETKLISDK